MVWNIAKNELRQMFCSPVAWILLVVFFAQSGMALTDVYCRLLRYGSLGYGLRDVTSQVFYDSWSGIYPSIQSWLFLYIPLITMGIFSREHSSGTWGLLSSSPVSPVEIVFGKFLSVAVYGAAMFSGLAICAVFGIATIEHIDIGPVLTGLLGLYLLLLTYASIGLFISALTRWQIVAAVGTVAVLFGLDWLTTAGQGIPVVRDIMWWMGISGRADSFVRGMVCSEDLIYFLAVTAMFLCLSVIRIRSMYGRRNGASAPAYIAVVAVLCGVAFVSSLPACRYYFDSTREKRNTLTEESQKVMAALDGPLTITSYVNLLGTDSYVGIPKSYSRDVERFEWYTRFKPETKMKYVYYWHESDLVPLNNRRFAGLDEAGKAEKMAGLSDMKFSRLLTHDEIDSLGVDLASEHYSFVRVIERGNGNSTKLRLYDDQDKHPGETEITAAMKRLLGNAPKVGLLTGHGERSMTGIGEKGYFTFADSHTFRYALINQGFDVCEVNLSDGGVPEDVSVLMIADPVSAIPDAEMSRINGFVARGGNLFIAGKPYNRRHLSPLMDSLGLRFMDGILVQEGTAFSPELTIADIAPDAVKVAKGYAGYIAMRKKVTGKGTMGIENVDAGSRGFEVFNVITTDSLACDTTRIWNELQVTDFENGTPAFEPASGETLQDRCPVLVALNRQVGDKEQRIVVLGNADMIANGELMTSRSGVNAANYALVLESFRFLSGDEFPVYAERPAGIDNGLRWLDRHSKKALNWTFNFILPLVLALWGMILLIRRRAE